MCLNFIQVSVKKLNLNSLKFSVTLYLTNIQKEVFIVSNEICNEVIMMIIQYIKLIILKIGWKPNMPDNFKVKVSSCIINNEGVGRDCVFIYCVSGAN